MLLKQGEESPCLHGSTANAQIVPVYDRSVSIMVVLIFMKEPTF